MSIKILGTDMRIPLADSVAPTNVLPKFNTPTELLLRQNTSLPKWSVMNPFTHVAAEPVIPQKPVYVAQLKPQGAGPRDFGFYEELSHVLNRTPDFLKLVPPTPAITFKVPDTLVPLEQPVRDAVGKFLATQPQVAKIVAESGNHVVNVPNAVEKDLLNYYQSQFEASRYFSPETDLVQKIGLLQKPNSLTTLSALQPSVQVSHALGEIYTDLTPDLRQKNDLLANVFHPKQPQHSQLKLIEPQDAALQSAFHEELGQQSTFVLGTLINLAQNVPSSEASLRYLAQGKVPVEIEVGDFVPASSIRSKSDLYQVSEQKGGGFKIQLHSQIFQIPDLKSYDDGVNAKGSEAERSPEDVYDDNQKTIRQAGVNAMHVFASAVNDAEKMVRQKVGDAPAAGKTQKQLDEIFSALEHQPVAYAVPSPRIAEAHHEVGDLRTAINDILMEGEKLDIMMRAAPPSAREFMQQSLNSQLPELAPHISANSPLNVDDARAHAQQHVPLEELDLNGWRMSDFPEVIRALRSRLNVINREAKNLTPLQPR